MPASPAAPAAQTTPRPTPPATPAPPAGNPAPDVQVKLCGESVTIKGETKPCVKEPGHKGKHSSRVYTPVDMSVLTLESATVDTFNVGEKVKILTDPGTRSEVQKHIDQDVADGYQAWKSHGKPTDLRAALNATYPDPRGTIDPATGKVKILTVARRYWVEPGHELAFRKALRSAGDMGGCQVRIYPLQLHAESGRHQLPWVARDQRETKAAKAAKAAAQALASPPSTPSAT